MGLSQGEPVAQPTGPSREEDVPMLTGPETVFDPTAAGSLDPMDEHVVVEDPAVVHEFSPLPGEGHHCDAGLHLGPAWMPGMGVDHLSLFGGVHGFKNGGNRGEDGSFGFHEGANFGTAARNIVFPSSIGLQLGFQATQSNIEGAAFTSQQRNQLFLTGGVFRRVDCGLQGGLVFDYLWDDWYYELQVGQARGEISAALNGASSIGVWFATSVDEDTVTSRVNGVSVQENWETTDIYALFFRSRMLAAGRGEGRLYAGFSGDSDGIIGADSRMPLTNGWALETDFTYLVPDGDEQFRDNQLEAWNLAINLVWYPGSIACGECFRAHRPLFDVANNGSLILRPQR
jgi:hypothetical protein